MLQKLLNRAQASFVAFQNGASLNKPSPGSHSDGPDTFGLWGSWKSVISDKLTPDPPTFKTELHQHHLSVETNQNTVMQFGHQQYEVPLSSVDYPVMDVPQETNEFEAFASFVHTTGRPHPSRLDPTASQHIDQAYMPASYPQQAPYITNHQPQQLSPIDSAVRHEPNQDDIWPDFIRHLGLTGERA